MMIRCTAVLLAAMLVAGGCTKSEPAPEPASEPAPPAPTTAAAPVRGLPMWVIRDADSTIYLTGTIHLLPPDLEWRSPKLEAALDEASELWLEIAIPADQDAFRSGMRPLTMQHAVSLGPPLSSRLTVKEREALYAALDRAGIPEKARAEIDRFKPWYVMNVISIAPFTAAGYSGDAGIDNSLARMARAQGDTIKGLEKVEDQLRVLSGPSEAQQLQALRMYLATPPAVNTGIAWVGGQVFEQWAKGNTWPIEMMVSSMTSVRGAQKQQVDALLTNRNENWAVQIEEMLNGSGVSFIAVGAAHLVGAESVQNRLKRRGITAERYDR
jgi:uncharacterized protein YbaP (TraB family)